VRKSEGEIKFLHFSSLLLVVQRASNAFSGAAGKLHIDDGRFQIFMPEKSLDPPDVIVFFKKPRGKAVAKRLAARRFDDICLENRLADRFLDG